jgi:processing peptidase subunit alpha
VSSLALFVEGGSSFETLNMLGASKVLEAVAFKSTLNRSTFRLTRELEKVGAVSRVLASRDSVAFGIDFVRLNSHEAVEMLVDSVVNARYTFWEVRDTVEAVKEQLALQLQNPYVAIKQVLHRAAFDGGLSNSLIVDPSQVGLWHVSPRRLTCTACP